MLELYANAQCGGAATKPLLDLASCRAELMTGLAEARAEPSMNADEACAVGYLWLLDAMVQ